jgi:hypothetical protein
VSATHPEEASMEEMREETQAEEPSPVKVWLH